MDKWLESPRQYPRLTLDTLAFAIALDILHNPDDHVEFIPMEAEDRLGLDIVYAVHADIRDLLHNGNGEDLFGPLDDLETTSEQLHDGWKDDTLFTFCTNIARLAYAAL